MGRRSGHIDVWDLMECDRVTTLTALPVPTWRMAFTPSNALVALLPDGVIHLSGAGFKHKELVVTFDDNRCDAEFSPDGRWAVVSTEGAISKIDLSPPFSKQWTRPAPSDRGSKRGAAFSPDGQLLAIAGKETVEIWNATSGSPLGALDPPSPTDRWFGSFLGWSPDGRLVFEKWQQWLNVWDAGSGRCVHQRVANRECFNDVAFHPSGRLVIVTSNRFGNPDSVVRPLARETWQTETSYSWPVGIANSLVFHSDGTLAAIGGSKPEIVVWDVDW